MSDIYSARPDPLMYIADNDFNSFIPINVVGSHQNDFHKGYRIYRTQFKLPKGNKFELELVNYAADNAEVYANGILVYNDNTPSGGEKNAHFSIEAKSGENIEVRVLLYNENAPYGGIRDGIKIVTE